MRQANRVGRTVNLRFRFDDFSRATRSRSLEVATNDTALILDACEVVLESMRATIERRGITLIGLSVSNLQDADAVQLALPFADALDLVRDRYGSASIGRLTNVGRDTGTSVPMLPD